MQKLIILLITIIIFNTILFADQADDLKFIIGLYKDNNFRLAKTEMIKFKDTYPDSPYLTDIDFLLANIYLRARQYKTAQEVYEDLYNDPAVDAARPDILQGLAQTKYFLKDLTGSALLFNNFIAEYPDHELYWNALYFLGRIALEQGDYSSASYYYLEATQISSNLQISIARLELFLITNNYANAKEIMQNMLKNAPGDPLSDQALIKLHNYNLQVKDFEEILLVGFGSVDAGSPYYEDYKLILGITRYEMGNYGLALEDLDDLRSVRADYYKALCYVELNETVKAIELFSETRNSENIEISSNSFFYIARLSADLDTSINLLTEFINTYPAHIYLSAAQYQLGFNYFQKENYMEARKNLLRSVESQLDDDSREKALFLIAESDYQLNEELLAYQEYSEYLENYSQGAFADEALFKIGLYLFERKNYPDAFIKFDQLISENPLSAKTGMSRFYIGEMFYLQNKYFDAERYFLKAREGQVDQGLIELRLAQIKFFLKEYDDVKAGLVNIPDNERYLFDKNILTGNLYFTLKDYKEALQAYDGALKYAPSSAAEEKVLNRKAWTLYQMKDYSKAAEIYKSLSLVSEGQSDYLMKAASSAFSAQDYTAAIELYKEFIELYPGSEEIVDARIGIANSYYNKGDFIQAALYYRELVIPDLDPEIVENSLNGLRWSCEQDNSLEYLAILNDILLEYDDTDFQTIILKSKIIYLDSKSMWTDVLQTYNQFDQSAADEMRSDYFQIYQARAMTRLDYFDQADQVFNVIDPEMRDAEIYSAWADLKLKQHDELGAIEKLRSASQKSRDYNIWLPLLELELKNSHELFLNDYNKFREFAGLQEKQHAMVLWIKWKIAKQETEGLNGVISKLSESKYPIIKANAQFLKGLLLYEKTDYETAIPELLRVRYLYPEYGDLRIEAEYYACQAYIFADRKDEAEQLYEIIRGELTPEMQQEIENGLQGDE